VRGCVCQLLRDLLIFLCHLPAPTSCSVDSSRGTLRSHVSSPPSYPQCCAAAGRWANTSQATHRRGGSQIYLPELLLHLDENGLARGQQPRLVITSRRAAIRDAPIVTATTLAVTMTPPVSAGLLASGIANVASKGCFWQERPGLNCG
jgi:hypothetical protein